MYTLKVKKLNCYAHPMGNGFRLAKEICLLTFDQSIKAADIFTKSGYDIVLESATETA